jgi:hypothetical protein
MEFCYVYHSLAAKHGMTDLAFFAFLALISEDEVAEVANRLEASLSLKMVREIE